MRTAIAILLCAAMAGCHAARSTVKESCEEGHVSDTIVAATRSECFAAASLRVDTALAIVAADSIDITRGIIYQPRVIVRRSTASAEATVASSDTVSISASASSHHSTEAKSASSPSLRLLLLLAAALAGLLLMTRLWPGTGGRF